MNGQKNSDEKTDIGSKLQYYTFVYQKTDSFRQNISNRASLIIAICAFLLGSIWTVLKDFTRLECVRIYDIVLFLMLTLFLGLSLLSLIYSVYSIFPFFWSHESQKRGLQSGISVLPVTSAFPYIAKKSRDSFKKQCLEMNEHGLLEDAINGIYNLSVILNKRYEYLKKSYILMFFTIFIFACLTLYYFIGKLYGIWR